MKKYSYTFLFIFISIQSVFCQKIKFQPVFINPCTGEIEKVSLWTIKKEKEYFSPKFGKKYALLSEPGKYYLDHDASKNDDEIEIIIDNTLFQTDTFYLDKLKLKNYVCIPSYSEYFVCNSLAEGIIEDYYFDGNLKIKATFKNGELAGSMKKYYRNGILREAVFNKKKEYSHKQYYRNGNVKFNHTRSKKETKIYYENGKLEKIQSWRNNKMKIKEFYKNGNLKYQETPKEMKLISKEGIILSKCSRKRIYGIIDFFMRDKLKIYKYGWKIYDDNGELKERIVFKKDKFAFPVYPKKIEEIPLRDILLHKKN